MDRRGWPHPMQLFEHHGPEKLAEYTRYSSCKIDLENGLYKELRFKAPPRCERIDRMFDTPEKQASLINFVQRIMEQKRDVHAAISESMDAVCGKLDYKTSKILLAEYLMTESSGIEFEMQNFSKRNPWAQPQQIEKWTRCGELVVCAVDHEQFMTAWPYPEMKWLNNNNLLHLMSAADEESYDDIRYEALHFEQPLKRPTGWDFDAIRTICRRIQRGEAMPEAGVQWLFCSFMGQTTPHLFREIHVRYQLGTVDFSANPELLLNSVRNLVQYEENMSYQHKQFWRCVQWALNHNNVFFMYPMLTRGRSEIEEFVRENTEWQPRKTWMMERPLIEFHQYYRRTLHYSMKVERGTIQKLVQTSPSGGRVEFFNCIRNAINGVPDYNWYTFEADLSLTGKKSIPPPAAYNREPQSEVILPVEAPAQQEVPEDNREEPAEVIAVVADVVENVPEIAVPKILEVETIVKDVPKTAVAEAIVVVAQNPETSTVIQVSKTKVLEDGAAVPKDFVVSDKTKTEPIEVPKQVVNQEESNKNVVIATSPKLNGEQTSQANTPSPVSYASAAKKAELKPNTQNSPKRTEPSVASTNIPENSKREPVVQPSKPHSDDQPATNGSLQKEMVPKSATLPPKVQESKLNGNSVHQEPADNKVVPRQRKQTQLKNQNPRKNVKNDQKSASTHQANKASTPLFSQQSKFSLLEQSEGLSVDTSSTAVKNNGNEKTLTKEEKRSGPKVDIVADKKSPSTSKLVEKSNDAEQTTLFSSNTKKTSKKLNENNNVVPSNIDKTSDSATTCIFTNGSVGRNDDTVVDEESGERDELVVSQKVDNPVETKIVTEKEKSLSDGNSILETSSSSSQANGVVASPSIEVKQAESVHNESGKNKKKKSEMTKREKKLAKAAAKLKPAEKTENFVVTASDGSYTETEVEIVIKKANPPANTVSSSSSSSSKNVTVETHFTGENATMYVNDAVFEPQTNQKASKPSDSSSIPYSQLVEEEDDSNDYVPGSKISFDYRPNKSGSGSSSPPESPNEFVIPSTGPLNPDSGGTPQIQVLTPDLNDEEFSSRASHPKSQNIFRRLKFLFIQQYKNKGMIPGLNKKQNSMMKARFAKFNRAYIFRLRIAKSMLYMLDVTDPISESSMQREIDVLRLVQSFANSFDDSDPNTVDGNRIDKLAAASSFKDADETDICMKGLRFLDLKVAEADSETYNAYDQIREKLVAVMKDQQVVFDFVIDKADFAGLESFK